MTAAARKGSEYQIRRRVFTCHAIRHASAKLGAISSVWMVSSAAPIARRSKCPRVGSRRRNARMTKMAVGTPKTMNGARHPNAYASRPPAAGPRNCPSEFAARCAP
jgi:hypothetical protein